MTWLEIVGAAAIYIVAVVALIYASVGLVMFLCRRADGLVAMAVAARVAIVVAAIGAAVGILFLGGLIL